VAPATKKCTDHCVRVRFVALLEVVRSLMPRKAYPLETPTSRHDRRGFSVAL
jgi:hypothetical protein